MSDSIESIYLAAKEDPVCDAFWIPIPYYSNKSKDSPGTMHYEGADYYDSSLECTDWLRYDITVRYPDVVFTFNPYDFHNFVTSVHQDFYCKRLWNFTDLLVYVPYYVATDDIAEILCTTPGCGYSDRVILQSEKIRDSHIRIFKEEYGNKYRKPEEKFIALGSPKYDKAINTKRTDCKLPDEWRKLIGDKKVVFYNTGVAAIMAEDRKYLEKIRYTLESFRTRRDVVLWWRPHPLKKETFTSLRPKLLGEYEQVIEDYVSKGYGIFDETPDLHRALAWTDAYYGYYSSLVPMYLIVGKPALIGNFKIPQGDTGGYPENGISDLALESIQAGNYFYEDSQVSLWELMEYLVKFSDSDGEREAAGRREENIRAANINADGTAGRAIYEYVKSEVLKE
jgi:hypothetical protein